MRRLTARWARRRRDDGYTLVELMVSMGITSVVMLLVTAGVLLASGTSARVDAASSSQQQAHLAFDKLDRLVRWAAAVTTPATSGGDAYVEWLYTATGPPTCEQLRLDRTHRQLQLRSWQRGDLTTVTAWQVLASGVTATTPFTTTTDGTGATPQTLRVTVTATAGGAKDTDTATQDVAFTAVNSGGVTAPTTACTEGRNVP